MLIVNLWARDGTVYVVELELETSFLHILIVTCDEARSIDDDLMEEV